MTLLAHSPGGTARPWIILAALVGIVFGMAIGPALAQDTTGTVPPGGFPPEHTIAVQGTGTIFAKPDMADISVGVDVTRSKLADARTDAATAMNAIVDALHALGINDADIETAYFNVNPTYDYGSSTPRATGFQVTNVVVVHLHNLDLLGDVVDNAIASGATTINGITFRVADPTDIENQARTAAVRDARAHADALAGAAGVTITGVQSISENSFSYPWPIYGDLGGKTPVAEPSTPIIPGNSQITINVTIVYTIG
jgi:uncharacterized protein YggE